MVPIGAAGVRRIGYARVVDVVVRVASIRHLCEVGAISIAFEVDGRVKDYDRYEGNHPADWARRFDVSEWGLYFATLDGERVGAAVVRVPSPGEALLWDLRVAPGLRGQGIGTALLEAVEEWATERKCKRLEVETQDINVAACRFYRARGFELGATNPGAYPECPEEVQLLWYKGLIAKEGRRGAT